MQTTVASYAVVVCCACCVISQAALCPSNCLCDETVIDCSNSQFSTVPHIQPQSSALVINFSSNSLTSLEDLQNFPSSQTTLDLSFNQISNIPLNVFSGEEFMELQTLNLTSNLIADVHFVFPSSLQVLKLSKNEIQHFCVERLKNLPQLRVLSLEHNGLKNLSCEKAEPEKSENAQKACSFQPLQRIKEVSLRGNKLKTLNPAVLRCFQNTHFLSLADNSIRSLPAKLFQTFQSLKFLDLSGNYLTFIPGGMFGHLSSLKFLSLARNQLLNVPEGLPMLEWLDLSYNAITRVPETQKSDIYPQEVFLLGSNPLHCDCHLLWLKELYDTREYLLKYIDVERNRFIPICAVPDDIRGETWDVLGDESFHCEDEKKGSKMASVKNPEKLSVIQLQDLAFRVREVGATHIWFEWDSLNLAKGKAEEYRDLRKMLISCHPFGLKQQKRSVAVPLDLGTHGILGLQPATAYVVCVSVVDSASQVSKTKTSWNDCVEVVTKDDEQFKLRDIYTRTCVVALGFILLFIKCCCTSGCRRDVSSREKNN